MKLLELLVQEKVQWPEDALWAVQDFDKELKFTETYAPPESPVHVCTEGVWYRGGYVNFDNLQLTVRASDWDTKAVSEDEYAAAVATANAEWVPVKWGDWEVGDELRFDGYTHSREHAHWDWVVGSTYAVVPHEYNTRVCGPTNGRAVPSKNWGFKFSKRKPSAPIPAPLPPIVEDAPSSTRQWYIDLAPVIAAAAEGKVAQYLASDGNWYNVFGAFISPNKYRVKPEEPKTTKVNGFDVPEPTREAPAVGAYYYVGYTTDPCWCCKYTWDGCAFDYFVLHRGAVHNTEEAAVAHAKAMLGIDPYAAEDADDEHS